MTAKSLLIGDIGGTNARFALANHDTPGFTAEKTLKCADYPSADDAIPWTIDAHELGKYFGIDRVRLLNDFEAIAYSVPFLSSGELKPIGLPAPISLDKDDFMVGVIGPGTGLGCVGLKRFRKQYIPLPSEGSHSGFAPETGVQIEILAILRERFERVSAERLVSGQGIENLYRALSRLHDEKRGQLAAAEIFAAAGDGSDERAGEAVELFFEILGQVAGDLALTLGAEDGIFIAGGIAQRYPDKLANSGFRSGFEHKGRHRSLLERIPTQLITHPQPGLLGAAYGALEMASDG